MRRRMWYGIDHKDVGVQSFAHILQRGCGAVSLDLVIEVWKESLD